MTKQIGPVLGALVGVYIAFGSCYGEYRVWKRDGVAGMFAPLAHLEVIWFAVSWPFRVSSDAEFIEESKRIVTNPGGDRGTDADAKAEAIQIAWDVGHLVPSRLNRATYARFWSLLRETTTPAGASKLKEAALLNRENGLLFYKDLQRALQTGEPQRSEEARAVQTALLVHLPQAELDRQNAQFADTYRLLVEERVFVDPESGKAVPFDSEKLEALIGLIEKGNIAVKRLFTPGLLDFPGW